MSSGRRSVEVRSLWDAHDTEERGYLQRKELEDLLRHLRKKLGGSGDLSPEAIKRCADVLYFNEETGELRQEAFGRRFQYLWAQKEELLELSQVKAEGGAEVKREDGDVPMSSSVSLGRTKLDTEDFPEGAACWALSPLIMTEKEDLKSAIKKEIPGPSAGLQSQLLVVESGRQDTSRLCVKDASGDIGWVSTKSKDGRPLLRLAETHHKDAEQDAENDAEKDAESDAEKDVEKDAKKGAEKDAKHDSENDAEDAEGKERDVDLPPVKPPLQKHSVTHEQSVDLVSELRAAQQQALQLDARNQSQEQDIELLQSDLYKEEKACKAAKQRIDEIGLKLAKEVDLRQQQEEKLKSAHLEQSEFVRTKTQLLEVESEAGRLRLELEDSRATNRIAQQEHKGKEEQHESRLAALNALMHDEVNKTHERLALSEMALTAAQKSLQILEDEEEAKLQKAADELKRHKDRSRAEAAAFDQCEFKLETVEKREKTRSLFENVQVEFHHKEKRTNEELREATQLRNEAAQAADEALSLRIKLAREDQDLSARQAFLVAAEQQAAEKLESASIELDRARTLTQKLNQDKAEAFNELSEAKRVSVRAREERELAHQQSMEAEMAAYEAMKACKAAEDDRTKVEHALLLVTEDLEKAARQHREGQDLALKGESSLRQMQAIEAQVAQYSEENRRLSQVLASERAACTEYRTEKERMQLELRDLSRLTRFASPRTR